MPVKQEEAARRFAALRRGVMTLEERADLQAWQRDKSNAAAFTEMEKVWGALDVARAHFGGPGGNAAQTASRQNFTRFVLLAATCVISLGLGVISHSGHSPFWTTLDWTNR